MTKFTVTLKALRAAGACFDGYNRLVRSLQGKAFTKDDEERTLYLHYVHKEDISILQILESNGIDDALWSLCCVEGCDRDLRLYAVWCARQVQHLMSGNRSIIALDVAEKYANGLVTKEDLKTASDAAGAAAREAARAATRAATKDATRAATKDAVWSAARAAAWAAAREAAWAAWSAARAAAWSAARAAASDAASDAAWSAARASHKDMLILMLNNKAAWQV